MLLPQIYTIKAFLVKQLPPATALCNLQITYDTRTCKCSQN